MDNCDGCLAYRIGVVVDRMGVVYVPLGIGRGQHYHSIIIKLRFG